MNWPDEFFNYYFLCNIPNLQPDSLHGQCRASESLITFNDLPGSKVDSDVLFNDVRLVCTFHVDDEWKKKKKKEKKLFQKLPPVSSRYFQFSQTIRIANWQFLCIDTKSSEILRIDIAFQSPR